MISPEQMMEHKIAVHIDLMFQCQSCSKIFDNKEKFKEHMISVHGAVPESSADLGKKSLFEDSVDDMQSMLLKRIAEEDNARKRSRGPYRKAAVA
jgi:hypothetical protein